MKILIAGGTGFVGRHLTHDFEKTMDDVFILTRSEQKDYANIHFIPWLRGDNELPDLKNETFDAVINLAGVSLSDGRYTDEKKTSDCFKSSRINGGAFINCSKNEN